VIGRSGRIILLAAAFCAVAATAAWCEVVFLDDGTILIGAIIGTDAGGTRYLAFDREIKVASQDIKRSEKDLKSLEGLPLTVELMDGSVLRGTIADYDPEIGLFLDISFGVLTVPNQSIKSIVDPARRLRFSGPPFMARAGASWYFPILDSAAGFGSSIALDAAAHWSLPYFRGLTVGLDARYSFADFLAVDTVQYSFASLQPEIGYSILFFRTNEDWTRMLMPFLSIGAGPVYVNLSDPSAYPSQLGELCLGFVFKLGLDIEIYQGWGLRLQGRGDLYLQQESPFVSISAGLMASYDR
jgi:small nuclear ribonucleoprotein (snRNP)-like protein